MKRVRLSDLTAEEKAKFACMLKDYIPQLGTNEDISGGDCVDEICELFDALGPQTCEYPREAVEPADDDTDPMGVTYWDDMRRRLDDEEDEFED